MNLQKQISRIQSMMGVINEDNKKTISYSAVVLDHESICTPYDNCFR
jgi:hypothetical protein